MKYITQDWTSTKDGYLFFVQRLQEMLFHYSDDIVKAPVHNTQTLLEEYVDNLALGIANIINILEPEAISIGGSMSHYEKLIFGRLKEKIYSGEYLFNKENPPKILTAQAGNDAGIIGATLIF